ncbi:MAG: preprotein translocase subunit SecY [Candidatus Eiseniibacteriota bacterium]
MALVDSIQNIFRIPELKKRLLFTLGMFAIYRLGEHIPAPGVNGQALAAAFSTQAGTLFGLYDVFVGGAFSRATIFALGIMPYISASIILQLLGVVVPYFEKLRKEGEEGQKKITQYTRYGTVIISLIQSYAYALFLQHSGDIAGAPVVTSPGLGFILTMMVTQTAGTILVMWLGEQITERGIGNGISLIIFINIIGRVPTDVQRVFESLRAGTTSLFPILAGLALLIGVIAAVVAITQGTRKIPVQYAKRMVGRRMYGGASTYIPLKVNTAGVIPIIFASSLMILPLTVASFFPPGSPGQDFIGQWLSPGRFIYEAMYFVIIVFFTYFYTAVVLNPQDVAENMRKYGGFVPGIRPGKKTAEYIDRVLTRITLPGAIALAVIAVLPDAILMNTNLPFRFGGTSVLIVVGVALDTLQQIESHLLMRHYEGFVKKGRIRGRRA